MNISANNKPTIITFNFNGYDKPHNHYLSSKFNLITISDDNTQLSEIKNPWEKTLYVRYHPFEFTDSNIVSVIDGSLIIKENVEQLLDTFTSSKCDIGLALSHNLFLRDRIAKWLTNRRIDEYEARKLYDFLKKYDAQKYEGCIANAFKIYRKNDLIKSYLNNTFEELVKGDIIRLDEVVSTLLLDKEFSEIDCMVFDNNIINGEVFQYTDHSTGKPIKLVKTYTIPKFKNRPVEPVYIGKAYHRKFEYNSEAMCLTKYLNSSSLREWIEHHLDLGFDHIHIFDNESEYNCQEICKEYGDKVSYELIQGSPRHYKIFDDYVNSDRCKSEWIMPIDDDEYLELNVDICSTVNDCIEWYRSKFQNDHMFAIRWKHLFPKKFHTECTGKILDYCTEEDPELATTFQPMGDRGVKTIVHRIGKIHYEEAEENPSGGHVPVHSLCNGARLFNGEIIKRCSCQKAIDEGIEPARLIHCRYKGYTWYKNKNKDIIDRNVTLDNTSGLNYIRNYRFNDILETLP